MEKDFFYLLPLHFEGNVGNENAAFGRGTFVTAAAAATAAGPTTTVIASWRSVIKIKKKVRWGKTYSILLIKQIDAHTQ